jgi:hypothetical protein
MRRELEAALALARTLDLADLPLLCGDLELIRVTALARLAAPAVSIEDKLLDIEQTAARLRCSTDFLYRNHKRLPFTRSNAVGGKLLFSSAGLDAYLRGKR